MSDSLKRIICCYIILQSSIISFFYALFVCLCVPLSVCLSVNQSVEFTPYTCESKGGANFGLITNSTAVYNPFKGKKFFYLHVAELSLWEIFFSLLWIRAEGADVIFLDTSFTNSYSYELHFNFCINLEITKR